MNKTILLAPNSFKECADALEIADILEAELESISSFIVLKYPISDGGDGFLNVCQYNFNGTTLIYHIKNIYDDQIIPVSVNYNSGIKAIYIESAEILGLKKVPVEFRNPNSLNSKGLGQLLRQIMIDCKSGKINVNEVIIGVGGTATVDFGLGAASVFGAKFFDHAGNEIDVIPENYSFIKDIIMPRFQLPFKIKVVTDVKTPLLGDNNAIHLYSKQKGASEDDIKILVNGFTNIYNILLNKHLIDSSEPLNGSGGGLAAGLQIFCNADLITSSEFITENLLSDVRTPNIDAVITGEGAFDKQSLENKGAHVVIEKFKNLNVPVFLVCGMIEQGIGSLLPDNVRLIELLSFFDSKEQSIKNYKTGLRKAVNSILNQLNN